MPRATELTLNNNVGTYKDNTHQINNYNEIANLNRYLLAVNTQEGNRLARTEDTLKSAILKARQQYLLSERAIELGNFKAKILYLSIVVLCTMLIVIGLQLLKKIPVPVSSIIITVLLLVYLFIIVMWMLNNKERRNINWNQYYWPNMRPKS